MDLDLFTLPTAASKLGMNVDRLRDLVDAGEIGYVLDGKRKKLAPSDLAAYIQKCRDKAITESHKPKTPKQKKTKSADVLDLRAIKERRAN